MIKIFKLTHQQHELHSGITIIPVWDNSGRKILNSGQ